MKVEDMANSPRLFSRTRTKHSEAGTALSSVRWHRVFVKVRLRRVSNREKEKEGKQHGEVLYSGERISVLGSMEGLPAVVNTAAGILSLRRDPAASGEGWGWLGDGKEGQHGLRGFLYGASACGTPKNP